MVTLYMAEPCKVLLLLFCLLQLVVAFRCLVLTISAWPSSASGTNKLEHADMQVFSQRSTTHMPS